MCQIRTDLDDKFQSATNDGQIMRLGWYQPQPSFDGFTAVAELSESMVDLAPDPLLVFGMVLLNFSVDDLPQLLNAVCGTQINSCLVFCLGVLFVEFHRLPEPIFLRLHRAFNTNSDIDLV